MSTNSQHNEHRLTVNWLCLFRRYLTTELILYKSVLHKAVKDSIHMYKSFYESRDFIVACVYSMQMMCTIYSVKRVQYVNSVIVDT